MCLSVVEWIDGRGEAMASQSGGHRRGWNDRRGTLWWHDARGGVEGIRERPEEAGTTEVLTVERGEERR
jgi:hypothetical protein